MGRKRTTGKTPQSTFRLTAENLADLDAIAARLSAQTGGKRNRADAVRYGTRLALTGGAIPLLGELGAGRPRDDPAEAAETLQVSGLYPADAVAYRVKGRSMEDDFILDGDYVVAVPKSAADSGQTVVAWINGVGCVLKRYDKKTNTLFSGNGKNRWTHPLAAEDLIVGVYVGLIRKG